MLTTMYLQLILITNESNSVSRVVMRVARARRDVIRRAHRHSMDRRNIPHPCLQNPGSRTENGNETENKVTFPLLVMARMRSAQCYTCVSAVYVSMWELSSIVYTQWARAYTVFINAFASFSVCTGFLFINKKKLDYCLVKKCLL